MEQERERKGERKTAKTQLHEQLQRGPDICSTPGQHPAKGVLTAVLKSKAMKRRRTAGRQRMKKTQWALETKFNVKIFFFLAPSIKPPGVTFPKCSVLLVVPRMP